MLYSAHAQIHSLDASTVRDGKGKIMTDLEFRILELYRQLPVELKQMMRLSAALAVCASDRTDQKAAPADQDSSPSRPA